MHELRGIQIMKADSWTAIAAVVVGATTVIALVWNVRRDFVTQNRLLHKEELLLKLDAYAQLNSCFEEVCDANNASTIDVVRVANAETLMNQAIAIIDLIAPKAVYQLVSQAEKHAKSPRTDEVREQIMDRLYVEMRLDLDREDGYEQYRSSI